MVSPPLASAASALYPETSEVAGDWEGRRADRRRKPGSGSSGAGGALVGKAAWGREGANRGRLGLGSGTKSPFPSKWRTGTSPRETPHPAAPNLENKGSGRQGPGRGAEVAGGRRWGAGRAPPHISSRGRSMESSFQPTLH